MHSAIRVIRLMVTHLPRRNRQFVEQRNILVLCSEVCPEEIFERIVTVTK